MSKAEPKVQKYMSYLPESVDAKATLGEAQQMMRENQIHHLPVLKDGKIFGVVSDRDIKMALGFKGSQVEKILVQDICHENPYQVDPETPLHFAAEEMAKHHYGSVLVVQNNKLVGILTTTDICQALADLLQQKRT